MTGPLRLLGKYGDNPVGGVAATDVLGAIGGLPQNLVIDATTNTYGHQVTLNVATDQVPALNALIAAAPQGATVFIPAGQLYVASAVENLNDTVLVQGAGISHGSFTGGTVIKALPSYTDSQIARNWTASSWQAGGALPNATVTNGSGTVTFTGSTPAYLVNGACVRGPGIPPGSKVASLGSGTFNIVNNRTSGAVTAAVAGGPIVTTLTIGEPDHFYPPILTGAVSTWSVRFSDLTFDMGGNSNITGLGTVHLQERSQVRNVTFVNTGNTGSGNVGWACFNNNDPQFGTGLIAGVADIDHLVHYGKGWNSMLYVDGTCGNKVPVNLWNASIQIRRTTSYFGPAGNDLTYADSPFVFVGMNNVNLDQLFTQASPHNYHATKTVVGTYSAGVLTATDGSQFDGNLMGAVVMDSAGNTAYISAPPAYPSSTLALTATSGALSASDTYTIVDNAWVRCKDVSYLTMVTPTFIAQSAQTFVGNTAGTNVITATDGSTFSTGIIGCPVYDTTHGGNIPTGATIVSVSGSTLTMSATLGTQTGDSFSVNNNSGRPIVRCTRSGVTGLPGYLAKGATLILGATISTTSSWTNGAPFIEDYGSAFSNRIVYQAQTGSAVGFNPKMIHLYDGQRLRYDNGGSPTPNSVNIGGPGNVLLVSQSNIASLSGSVTIDGVSPGGGSKVLLTAQSTGSQNGPWIVNTSGAWLRPPEFSTGMTVDGASFTVQRGTAGTGTVWTLVGAGNVVDTTSLSFAQPGSSRTAVWLPSDDGLAGCNFDPAALSAASAFTSGTVYATRVYATSTKAVTQLLVYVSTLGSSLTNCYVALHDSSGAVLATSSDQSAGWVATGTKAITISASVTQGQFYYITILANSTGTMPKFQCGQIFSSTVANGNNSAPVRWMSVATGQTSIANFTPASGTATGNSFWAAMK